jgi:hypothetical protein
MTGWTEQDYADYLAQRRRETLPDAPPAVETRSEAQIEAEVTKLLEEDGWRALRTDPVSDRGRGKGFGEVGMADHQYVRYGLITPHPVRAECFWGNARACAEVLWVEFKAPGGKPKKHQLAWHNRERARGALTLIAGVDFPASVEGWKQWYAASGLQRGGAR